MRRRGWTVAVVAALGLLAGCRDGRDDLLVAYSGDCQGYIEPCG